MFIYIPGTEAPKIFSCLQDCSANKMARLSIALLLAAALLCINPVNSEFSLLLRGRTEETPVETQPVETAIEAKEPEDVPVSMNQLKSNRFSQLSLTSKV